MKLILTFFFSVLLAFVLPQFAEAKRQHFTQAQPQRAQVPDQGQPHAALSEPSPTSATVAQSASGMAHGDRVFFTRLLYSALGLAAGGAIGLFFSQRMWWLRRYVVLTVVAILTALGVIFAFGLHEVAAFLASTTIAAVATWVFFRERDSGASEGTFGSAKFADVSELEAKGVLGPDVGQELSPGHEGGASSEETSVTDPGSSSASAEVKTVAPYAAPPGFYFGTVRDGKRQRRVTYKGNRHLLAVGATRSFKTASIILPNALDRQNCMVIVDPKGAEITRITAEHRGKGRGSIPGLGQEVHIVDPWGIANVPGYKPSCFNPIDLLIKDPENAIENAFLLSEALILERPGVDPFWVAESRGLMAAFCLFVAFDESQEGFRNIGSVRDALNQDDKGMQALFAAMSESPHSVVAGAGRRMLQKERKLLSSILAEMQSQTHWLESPRIRASLSRSDFDFADMKRRAMTIYLVLPATKLDTYGRWLRVLIQQALTAHIEELTVSERPPILYIIDEAAAIGHLSSLQRAYGLLAGYGVQVLTCFQDLVQARTVYGEAWESLVGSAGALSYLGSADALTSEYVSKLAGVSTIYKFSISSAIAKPFGLLTEIFGLGKDLQEKGVTRDAVQRQLAYPDELRRMPSRRQLLFIEGCNPIRAEKLGWFEDPQYKRLGVNLQQPKAAPATPATKSAARPEWAATQPGVNLSAAD